MSSSAAAASLIRPLLLLVLLVAAACELAVAENAPVASFVTREGSRLVLDGQPFRYAGCNMYWAGLDENCEPGGTGGCVAYPTQFRIEDAIATAAALGTNVIRAHTLGISTGNPLSLQPNATAFNDQAFETIDYFIATAKAAGIRVVVPLTDDYDYYEGSYHNFLFWNGIACTDPAMPNATSPCMNFYTNQSVITMFRAYVAHLLNHVNKYTGVVLKDEPTILAWETGNELQQQGQPFTNWTDSLAAYIKETLGAKQLVMDGRANEKSPDPLALANPHVDIMSDHYYMAWDQAIQLAIADGADAAVNNKVFIVGEYGAAASNATAIAPLLNEFETNNNISGDTWWSFFPHGDYYGFVPHGDGFTLHFPEQGILQDLMLALRQHAYTMRGLPVPSSWPLPAAPLITSAKAQSNGGVVLAWRGAAPAINYTVARSTSANGPWTVICQQCATDYDTPWTDSQAAAGTTYYYRVQGFNMDGTGGAWSPVVTAGI